MSDHIFSCRDHMSDQLFLGATKNKKTPEAFAQHEEQKELQKQCSHSCWRPQNMCLRTCLRCFSAPKGFASRGRGYVLFRSGENFTHRGGKPHARLCSPGLIGIEGSEHIFLSKTDETRARYRERHPSLNVIQMGSKIDRSGGAPHDDESDHDFDRMFGRTGQTVGVDNTHRSPQSVILKESSYFLELKKIWIRTCEGPLVPHSM